MSAIINQIRLDQNYAQKTARGKILLVTGNLGYNYGNVLQRYALSHVLMSLGFQVTHLLCSETEPSPLSSIKRKAKSTMKFLLSCLGMKKYRVAELRGKRFINFKEKFIFSKVVMTFKELFKTPASRWSDYDYILAGSDVVWAYHRTINELKCFYLVWAEREKRINYAPSFGYSILPETNYEIHCEGLSGFDRLSCREKEGCKIIERITGRKAQMVLDPTLLLDAEYWRAMSRKPSYPLPERYVLVYILSEFTPEYMEYVKAIQEMAGGMPIINIYDPEIEELYVTDPAEFVYLIDHADFVCTNSFHGVAFSINLGKNFLAFGRNNGLAKIESILKTMSLTNNVYSPSMKARPEEINYDAVNTRLNEMRESSMQYLRECLKIWLSQKTPGNFSPGALFSSAH